MGRLEHVQGWEWSWEAPGKAEGDGKGAHPGKKQDQGGSSGSPKFPESLEPGWDLGSALKEQQDKEGMASGCSEGIFVWISRKTPHGKGCPAPGAMVEFPSMELFPKHPDVAFEGVDHDE